MSFFTAQDVLDDIEFELLQGTIAHDDLGRGIAAIKQHQSKLRAELLAPEQAAPDLREALGRQFQLNDMLLTLLHETAVALQANNQKIEQISRHRPVARPPQPSAPTDKPAATADDTIWRQPDPLQQAATTKLTPQFDMQPATIPVIGGWLQRLRHAAHSLVLFYLGKLSDKQQQVNQTYTNWLLYHHAVHQYQAEEIAQLRQQIADLQAQLTVTNAQNDDG
jgi:hypothetical protein